MLLDVSHAEKRLLARHLLVGGVRFVSRSLTALINVVQVHTQAPMAGRALLVAGVLALACVASASVQSTQLDHEGECLDICLLHTNAALLYAAS